MSGGTAPQQNSGQRSSGIGWGGCVATVFFILLVLAILGRVSEGGNTVGLILLAIAVVGVYVSWHFLSKPNVGQTEVTHQNYEWLGQEVKAMFVDLAVPVKNELRKSRIASDYEEMFSMDFFDLICHFAAVDGTIDTSEGAVFLDIFKVLHPRTYAGLSAEDGVALLEGHRQRHPESLQVPIQKYLLFTVTQQAGEPFANKLKELVYKVALQVALADGPLSPIEQTELEARILPTHYTPPHKMNDGSTGSKSDSEPPTVTDQSRPSVVKPVGEPLQTDGVEKQNEIQSLGASGGRTLESLKEATKDLVEVLEEPLRTELRKTRQSSMVRDLLEQDIRATIIRFGFSDGTISKDAANLYLELFRHLHPKTYAGWTVDNSLSTLHQILGQNADAYTGVLKKAFTLGFIERFDASHGTNFTMPTCDLLLAIAVFAAAVNGKVSDEKQAEVIQLKAILEAPTAHP